MIRAVEKVRERLLPATSALESARVPYAVAGDCAVAAWVATVDEAAVRNPRYIKILLRRSDFATAKRALESSGFFHGIAEAFGRVPAFSHFFTDGIDGSGPDAVHIWFASENPGKNADDSPDISKFVQGRDFHVLELEALIRMMLDADRDSHRMHLRDLIEVGLLDRSILDRLPAELRSRMQHIFDTPEG